LIEESKRGPNPDRRENFRPGRGGGEKGSGTGWGGWKVGGFFKHWPLHYSVTKIPKGSSWTVGEG